MSVFNSDWELCVHGGTCHLVGFTLRCLGLKSHLVFLREPVNVSMFIRPPPFFFLGWFSFSREDFLNYALGRDIYLVTASKAWGSREGWRSKHFLFSFHSVLSPRL